MWAEQLHAFAADLAEGAIVFGVLCGFAALLCALVLALARHFEGAAHVD